MYVKRQRGVKVGWVRQLFFCLIFLISDACLSVLDSGWKTRSHAGFHYTIARFMKILHEYNKMLCGYCREDNVVYMYLDVVNDECACSVLSSRNTI